MAGDWIKMRVDLATSPKVVRMASALRADRLRVVGGLHAVWCLFDVHSVDGELDGYTLEALDELIGFPGFASAMEAIGWLESGPDYLRTPRFDEHNGQSAKRRAMETERKRAERSLSASGADKKRTREEKRREEIRDKTEARTEGSAPAGAEDAAQPKAEPTQAGVICRAMKACGIGDTNPGNATLLLLIEAGATIAEFEGAARAAVKQRKGFAYAIGALKGQRADAAEAAKTMPRGAMPEAGKTTFQAAREAEVNAWFGSQAEAMRRPHDPNIIDMEATDGTPRLGSR